MAEQDKTQPEKTIRDLIDEDRNERVQQCSVEIEAVLKKYNCGLEYVTRHVNGILVNGVVQVTAGKY